MSTTPPDNTGENRDQLGRFIPGKSGNPQGRPTGSISISDRIRSRLALIGPDGKRQIIDHLVDNIIQDALEGKNGMDKLIWAYLDGKPRQADYVEHTMPQSLIDLLKDAFTEDYQNQPLLNR